MGYSTCLQNSAPLPLHFSRLPTPPRVLLLINGSKLEDVFLFFLCIHRLYDGFLVTKTAHLRVPYTRFKNVCHHGDPHGQYCPSTPTTIITTTTIGPTWTCTSICVNNSPNMSASQLDRLSASADGLLTNEECFMLLDIDIFNDDDDLLKNFPSAAKVEDVYHHDEVSASLYPASPPDTKPSPAELANDLLQQLESQCKQENIFLPNWLEEKVDLPIFESIPHGVERVEPPAPVAVAVPAPAALAQSVGHTEELLREFETVYGAVELTHLTPPQSPPGPAAQLLLSYAQNAQAAWQHAPEYAWGAGDADAVDELVRQGAAQLPSPHASPASSPRSSAPSSPRSSATDEEWSGPARPKPYARHPEERRSRKKEQNKNAATRYRQKKKAEIEVLLGEEATLRQRHGELGDKCSDLQREIRYLKGLMRDLFKAKGLIK